MTKMTRVGVNAKGSIVFLCCKQRFRYRFCSNMVGDMANFDADFDVGG